MRNPLQAIFLHPIASAYKISTKVPISFPALIWQLGYRHVPLVDLQGEKYIYSTLFVKIAWSLNEHILERPLAALGKLEKKAKAKARLAKLEEGSRSETSIESTGSSMSTSVDRMDREMEKIAEVSEATEK